MLHSFKCLEVENNSRSLQEAIFFQINVNHLKYNTYFKLLHLVKHFKYNEPHGVFNY